VSEFTRDTCPERGQIQEKSNGTLAPVTAPVNDQRRTLVAKLERHESAIMLTDIVGYTRLMRANEERALQLLEEHNAIVRECVDKYSGFVAKVMGDAFLVEFFDPQQSVSCALEIQVRLQARNLSVPEERKVFLRIGLHYAQVTPVGSDIIGDGVNVVSRIEPMAEPGGICLSQSLYEKVKDRLVVGVRDLGPQVLKNIDEPVHLYQIDPAGVPKEQKGPPSEVDFFTQTATKLGADPRKWLTPALATGAALVVVGVTVWAFRHPAPPPKAPPARIVEPATSPPPEKPVESKTPPDKTEAAKPETHEIPEHHVTAYINREHTLHERLKKALAKLDKLPPRRQKKVAPDLDGWRKIEKELFQGKKGLDLDGLDRRIGDLERQLGKG
jgi:class 3 adenylate cyclase